MPIALLFLFLLSGGTSFVAKDSLPGDFLYPVKINVNENVESLLALNDKQDALVDVKQATRRLDEAKSLSLEGNLTPEKSAEIKKSFENKINDMNVHLRKLTGKGDTQFISEVNDKLEVEVDDNFDVFSKVSANATDTPVFSDLIQRINDRHKRGGENEDMNNSSSSLKMEDGEKADDNNKSSINTLRVREDGDGDNENEGEGDDDNKGSVITNTPTPVSTPTPSPTSSSTVLTFTMAQVAMHNKITDCYSVVSGGVYDLTSWINQHPGGSSAIISLCGIDGTNAFMAQHGGQGNPAAELASLKIGILK